MRLLNIWNGRIEEGSSPTGRTCCHRAAYGSRESEEGHGGRVWRKGVAASPAESEVTVVINGVMLHSDALYTPMSKMN